MNPPAAATPEAPYIDEADNDSSSAILTDSKGNRYLISIEVITPEIAGEYLALCEDGRPEKTTAVEKKYVPDIQNDRWRINGSTFTFDREGVFRDGNNRCRAVRKAGKPIEVIVVRGVEAESVATMDAGVPRSLPDHLAMIGYSRYANKIAPIAKALYWYTTSDDNELLPQGAITVSNTALNSVLQDKDLMAEVTEAARFLTATFKYREDEASLKMSTAAFGLLYILAARGGGRPVANEFFHRLAMPAGPDWSNADTDPEMVARRRLIGAFKRKERMTDWDILYVLIRAWNARQQDKQYTKAQPAKGDTLPAIIAAAPNPYGRLEAAPGLKGKGGAVRARRRNAG